MAGIPAARVVAVIATLDTGKTQIGSGYLLDAAHILTAQHCTLDKETGRPATGLSVARASDGSTATVILCEASPTLDVALLALNPDAPWDADLPGGPVTFGKVDREQSAQLIDCEAVGYPLWQGSEAGNYRDVAELHGHIRALEGRESQRLVLRDPTLAGVAAAGQSAWGGLSGAAVFHGRLLLGVIIEHHPRQGETALQVRPVEAIATATDDATLRLGAALGITRPGALRNVATERTSASASGDSGQLLGQDREDIPRLPREYVDRVADREAVEGLLSVPGGRVAIYGLPGIGKTALAAKIAAGAVDSLAVHRVLWADFGQAVDAVAVLRDWCQKLRAEISAVTGTPGEQLEQLRLRLSEAVSGQCVLFVLDDVGSSQGDLDAASSCLIDGGNCRYLLTTISARTADSHEMWSGFGSFHMRELRDAEAEMVLERYTLGRLSLATLDDPDRTRLLRLGSGLPLGLMMLGRFFAHGLRGGATVRGLLGKLDSAESLVQQENLGMRLRLGRGGERGSIYTILMARWVDLPPDEKEALQTAAVFREKPHAFEETAWAGILMARGGAPEDLVQSFGWKVARAKIEDPADLRSLDAADDEDLQIMIEACERLEPLRKALMETGFLEQPVIGVPSFTMHSLIAAFLRTIPGLDAGELKNLHGLAARYHRGWLAGYQEDHASASPFKVAYRFENRRWQSAMLNLCYHLRQGGGEDEAVLLLATLFFDAFWWWGEVVPYPFCDELLRMWQVANLGAKANECLSRLLKFNERYPTIDLGRCPPDDPRALPSGYQDGTQAAAFQAVRGTVQDIRDQFLDGVAADVMAERDQVRLRMLTSLYLGEANRVTGRLEQAARNYQETLELLAQLGQDGDDSDDWLIPFMYAEVADLHVRADDPAKALAACCRGAQTVAGDGEILVEDLGDSDIDHEVLGWLWLAAGNAHWGAGRLPAAWRSYAWACFHACTAHLWPEREVLFRRPVAIAERRGEWVPERGKEYGVDDYTVTCYKLHLVATLDRIGELWTSGRRAEACDGIRIIRQTLAGGPGSPRADPDGTIVALDEVAATRPDAIWEDCRDLAWDDTGLALPLVPWELLTGTDDFTDHDRVDRQRLVASNLAARLRDIWACSRWTVDSGPGQWT